MVTLFAPVHTRKLISRPGERGHGGQKAELGREGAVAAITHTFTRGEDD